MNIYELLQNPALRPVTNRQEVTTGIIIGPDQTRYRINIGGLTYLADATVIDLQPGDWVYVAIGWGSPRILGRLAPDQGVPVLG